MSFSGLRKLSGMCFKTYLFGELSIRNYDLSTPYTGLCTFMYDFHCHVVLTAAVDNTPLTKWVKARKF